MSLTLHWQDELKTAEHILEDIYKESKETLSQKHYLMAQVAYLPILSLPED